MFRVQCAGLRTQGGFAAGLSHGVVQGLQMRIFQVLGDYVYRWVMVHSVYLAVVGTNTVPVELDGCSKFML